eukprot:TRINITY_DN49526_c0_g1_i1.p1 TRINITY_DN49526_c0_g1~~TRINITY_DN49526_c0_g1_i1.p1  ORF type:complete len:362 (+),score=37.40 TRINITY_DN49526_c0_g1_i1:64-1086(+)
MGSITTKHKRNDGLAVLEGSSIFVHHAGADSVNGEYTMQEGEREGAPWYRNGSGIMLHRYRLSNGSLYWYFSSCNGDVTRSDGDYYRVKTDSQLPLSKGWSCSACPSGLEPVPQLDVTTAAASSASTSCEGGRQSQRLSAREVLNTWHLSVSLMSGEALACLEVDDSWSVQKVRKALRQELQTGRMVANLFVDGNDLEGEASLGTLGITSSSEVYASIVSCDYLVEEAGATEVNGCYSRRPCDMNGAPSYSNESGTLLFRYVMPRGTVYWYFSSPNSDLSKAQGDYYRARNGADQPPMDGWMTQSCPLGKGPLPKLLSLATPKQEESSVDLSDHETAAEG